MLYKPNYCCNCGEKIQRVEWNLLTSRRFCESCAVEKRHHDYGPRILAASGVLAIMFSIGNLWGSADSDRQMASAVPLTSKSAEHSPPGPVVNPGSLAAVASPNADPSVVSPKADGSLNTPEPKPNKSAAGKFYCRALTKKGTPCSRKVRTEGSRCFQHEGKAAAPPQN